MRGLNVLGEARASYRVCPSCLCRTVGPVSFGGSQKSSNQINRASGGFPTGPRYARRFNTVTTKRLLLTGRNVHTPTKGGPPTPPPDNSFILNNPALEKEEEDILALINDGEAGRLMAAFLGPTRHHVFTRLPPAIFAEALRMLSPAYFVEPYKAIQEHIHLRFFQQKASLLRRIFRKFWSSLFTVVQARENAGHKPGPAEYTHLLACAGSMGRADVADEIWKKMAENGVIPSVECYNHYMEAKAWYNTYYLGENHNLPSTKFNYTRRSNSERSPGYTGYGTGIGGTRDEVHDLFNEMVQKGLEPDTATYIQLMVASGREWDLAAVLQVLRDVWNVDVEVLSQAPSEHPPVAQYPESSPLRPTPDLLYAIAHIFGSNNDFSTALQVVDFLSTRYHIPIPERAWDELLVWSFVLASRGFRADTRKKGKHLPTKAVLDVYSVMTSEPYKVAPSMRKYDVLVKLKWYRQTWDQLLRDFRAGLDLFLQTVSKRNDLKNKLDSLLPNNPYPGDMLDAHTFVDLTNFTHLIPTATSDACYWDTFHAFQIQQMKTVSEAAYVRRWGHLLFSRRKWTNRYDWERRSAPDAIMEFKEYMSEPVCYRTTGGDVQFASETVWPDGRPELDRLVEIPSEAPRSHDHGQAAERNSSTTDS